jgi:hypothetical protein
MFDQAMLASAHADPTTGQMVFQYGWCGRLMDYLAHPARADREEIASLLMFAHEAMHVRGELDEARAECEAVQRYRRAAVLLGVPDALARRTGLAYFRGDYQLRRVAGGLSGSYYSAECRPGGALDEHLPDSTWADE